ncbi:hypothetical protein JX580_09985 [Thiomicrospira microaerophila]|uniref:hypothetical protein n=1 Tax=Thiomicrospira microaerophila TaxID=406020 RepID=UPI0020109B8F|nr:hypothetical protein [Thiomicrospira microaerophila]UQB41982.1 hypothetical protein JX580_09985 [Thiomicrospira microaerophila]
MKWSSAILKKHSHQFLFWDQEEQVLWLDTRRFFPEIGVMRILGWDWMILGHEPVPDYPVDLDLLNWSVHSHLRFWLQLIPAWVVDSCRLFPSHQLRLLHTAARYPQMLELLDHSPMLAWHLAKLELTDFELERLLQAKRMDMLERLGWPGKNETLKFLRNLRLRKVNDQLLEQVEICLLDVSRLDALTQLPRINSMALSLAAAFPQLIGHRLHQTLARLPCRPMQCQSMIALLEDVYRLAESLGHSMITQSIGDCRYLVEVEALYQAWLLEACPSSAEDLKLTDSPKLLTSLQEWAQLSRTQHQAWWLDFQATESCLELWAWNYEQQPVAVLLNRSQTGITKLVRCRQGKNQLPSAALQTQIELWLLKF